MKLTKRFTSLTGAAALALSAMATPMAAQAENSFTGNIGIYSKYLLRGIFEENGNTAVQGGFDYAWDSGWYLGYWGSNLGYSYEATPDNVTDMAGFENDVYGGYSGSAGEFEYNVGLIQYIYVNVDDSDLTELLLSGGFKGWTLQAQYLLADGWWGNAGDIYWTFYGGFSLPKDFGLDFKVGYYMYEDDDNDKLGGYNPALPSSKNVTTTTSEFRHFDISLTHPVGSTGADMALTYTVAGKDRTKTEYGDSVVLSVAWGFDI